MPFPPRDSQTRIKHEILRQFAGAWSGIICNGLRTKAGRIAVELVYLDLFAGKGVYEGDADKPELTGPAWGSPIIAVRELEITAATFRNAGLDVRVTAIVVDKEHAQELAQSLRSSGLTSPIREIGSTSEILRGTVSVLSGDCRDFLPQLVSWLRHDDFAFALVDPYGETMALSDLRPLLTRQRIDAIVLFPVTEVDKHGGSVNKPPAKRTPVELTNLRRTSDHFGTDDWMEIAASQAKGSQLAEREERYAELYAQRLRTLKQGLIVKKIGLQFSKVDRTGYHLFLTTPDSDGALRMNDILQKAEIREHWTLWSDREARVRAKEQSLNLFEIEYTAPPPKPTIPAEEIADVILRSFGTAKVLELKDLQTRLANDVYTKPDVEKGLRYLKRKEQVDFEDLKSHSMISRRN